MEPTVNIQNLTKLINHLRRIRKENFDMRQWVNFNTLNGWFERPAGELVERLETVGDCGTVACVAGHAALLIAAEEGLQADAYDGSRSKSKASEWLGLTYLQANDLFQPEDMWGHIVSYNLDDALKTLEHLKNTAETGRPEVNWQAP